MLQCDVGIAPRIYVSAQSAVGTISYMAPGLAQLSSSVLAWAYIWLHPLNHWCCITCKCLMLRATLLKVCGFECSSACCMTTRPCLTLSHQADLADTMKIGTGSQAIMCAPCASLEAYPPPPPPPVLWVRGVPGEGCCSFCYGQLVQQTP